MSARPRSALVTVAIICAWPSRGAGEDLDAPDPVPGDTTRDEWNEYQGRYFSIRVGAGLLLDYVIYDQSEDSQQQMTIGPEAGIRDLRGLIAGRLPWSRLSYTLGYMFDEPTDTWRFRQTGLKLQVPELGGYLFVGRTKEGFSTNKMMVGYYGWFNERAAVNDAFLPILADGARWTASVLGGKLVYNLGAFADRWSDKEAFNKNDWVVAGRAVWLPLAGTESDRVLHLAAEVRYAGANDGFLRYRSKPESFLAQSFAVDTGMFEASRSTMIGIEAYHTAGPLSIGGEYFFNKVSSTPTNHPFFHGGEVFAAYLLTGETHPYNVRGGYFDDVVPAQSLLGGGPGAWELALRFSYIDLDSELVAGGKFWRLTPLVNWYVSDSVRFEASYGYGVLDRFGMDGATRFFQTRMQVTIPTK